MNTNDTNPYEILSVSPDASNPEINQAFAVAMKQRKYPVDAIAKARKCLINPKERIMADYFRPILPENISDFQREDFSPLEESAELEFLPEFDGLSEAISNIEQVSEIDLRVGSNLVNLISYIEKDK
jgi:hypothetical protein